MMNNFNNSNSVSNPSYSLEVAAHEAAIEDGLIATQNGVSGLKVLDLKMKSKAGLRRGKWTTEEECYANRLIYEFKLGLLPLTDGTTLRTFLSKLLNCDPMRISKKFVGQNCIGKQVFRRRQQELEKLTNEQIEASRKELAELERKFLERVAQTNRTKTSNGGVKGMKDGKLGYEDENGNPALAPWMLPPSEEGSTLSQFSSARQSPHTNYYDGKDGLLNNPNTNINSNAFISDQYKNSQQNSFPNYSYTNFNHSYQNIVGTSTNLANEQRHNNEGGATKSNKVNNHKSTAKNSPTTNKESTKTNNNYNDEYLQQAKTTINDGQNKQQILTKSDDFPRVSSMEVLCNMASLDSHLPSTQSVENFSNIFGKPGGPTFPWVSSGLNFNAVTSSAFNLNDMSNSSNALHHLTNGSNAVDQANDHAKADLSNSASNLSLPNSASMMFNEWPSMRNFSMDNLVAAAESAIAMDEQQSKQNDHATDLNKTGKTSAQDSKGLLKDPNESKTSTSDNQFIIDTISKEIMAGNPIISPIDAVLLQQVHTMQQLQVQQQVGSPAADDQVGLPIGMESADTDDASPPPPVDANTANEIKILIADKRSDGMILEDQSSNPVSLPIKLPTSKPFASYPPNLNAAFYFPDKVEEDSKEMVAKTEGGRVHFNIKTDNDIQSNQEIVNQRKNSQGGNDVQAAIPSVPIGELKNIDVPQPQTSNSSFDDKKLLPKNAKIPHNSSVDNFWMLVNMGVLPAPDRHVLSEAMFQNNVKQLVPSVITSGTGGGQASAMVSTNESKNILEDTSNLKKVADSISKNEDPTHATHSAFENHRCFLKDDKLTTSDSMKTSHKISPNSQIGSLLAVADSGIAYYSEDSRGENNHELHNQQYSSTNGVIIDEKLTNNKSWNHVEGPSMETDLHNHSSTIINEVNASGKTLRHDEPFVDEMNWKKVKMEK